MGYSARLGSKTLHNIGDTRRIIEAFARLFFIALDGTWVGFDNVAIVIFIYKCKEVNSHEVFLPKIFV